MTQLEIIKRKILNGTATVQELGWAVTQDQHILFNMLMDNNLADVNVTLRTQLGHSKDLPVFPYRKGIQQVIDSYIMKSDINALQTILDEFDYNPKANNYTTHAGFLQQLKSQAGK